MLGNSCPYIANSCLGSNDTYIAASIGYATCGIDYRSLCHVINTGESNISGRYALKKTIKGNAMKKITAAFVSTLMINSPVMAQDSDALNICALAIPLFKEYVVSYEYLYEQRHGLVTRLEHGSMSDGASTGTNQALVINYRWHFSESMESLFIGPWARYREVRGSGSTGGAAFEFTTPEWTIGINIGKRWVWENGFNVVVATGSGVSQRDPAPTNASAAAALAAFKKDNTMFVENSSYSEFSIGYVF